MIDVINKLYRKILKCVVHLSDVYYIILNKRENANYNPALPLAYQIILELKVEYMT